MQSDAKSNPEKIFSINMKVLVRLLMATCLFTVNPLLLMLTPQSAAESFNFYCKRVGYSNGEDFETWIIDKSLSAVSRVRERLEPTRVIETTRMLDVEVLAKEIRGWDPASGKRFQILLDDKLIILEGYFLNCSPYD